MRALSQLISTPQNNFRVFKDLEFVYGEERRGNLSNILTDCFSEEKDPSYVSMSRQEVEDCFSRLILQSLNQSLDLECNYLDEEVIASISNCQLHHYSYEANCDCDHHVLNSGSVLSSLMKGQQLDSLSGQDALDMVSHLHAYNPDFMQELRRKDFCHFISTPSYKLPGESKEQFYLRMLWQYIVSLTLKDCSIMITMQRIADAGYNGNNGDVHYISDSVTGLEVAVSVAVVDLDPKLPDTYDQLKHKLHEIIQLQESAFKLLPDQNANHAFVR